MGQSNEITQKEKADIVNKEQQRKLQGTLGVIFSLAYIKSGYKLYVPILIHMIYNILV